MVDRRYQVALWTLCIASVAAADDPSEFFEKKVRPILARHCYECHSTATKDPKGKLVLDSREPLLKGGESGPAIVPGKPEESLLISAVRHESLEMPPGVRLPEEAVADLAEWIRSGAFDPRDKPADAAQVASETWQAQFDERRTWWSLQPVTKPSFPAVRDEAWPANGIDRFVLAKLEQHGLHPAPRAERNMLVRRLSFALTGLPPTQELIEQFLADESSQAWESLVDQLLASPHFGEQWARHWMDVVRYTDTYGYEWDIPAKGAWRYRDYFIRALNSDVPFDQLIREQIAGDLLDRPRIDELRQINESKIGLMFFQMGEKRHGDSAEFNGIHQEMLDNKIDAFGKAFQAMTLSCARCHDHKLDAISQHEYYALGGIFMSSRWVTNTADLPGSYEQRFGELQVIKDELRRELAEAWKADLQHLAQDIQSALEPATGSTSRQQSAIWRGLLETKPEGNVALENVLFPIRAIVDAAREQKSIPEAWQQLVAKYSAERDARQKQNAADYVQIVDLRNDVPAGWSTDGIGLGSPSKAGELFVSLEGESAVSRLSAGGRMTHAFSPRMNGALRTPHLREFNKAFISFEYCGGDFAAARTVVDNAFLTERQQYLAQPAMSWLTLSTQPAMKDRRVYIELATKGSNPNFPPRVGLGGECSEAQVADPKSYFGVRRIVLHDKPAPPADELARFTPLFQGETPQTLEQAVTRYAGWFRNALEVWNAGTDCRTPAEIDDAIQLMNWLLEQRLLTNSSKPSDHPRIAELLDRYRTLERQLPEPHTVNGMHDVESGFDYALNIRGDYDQLGPSVPRGYLRVLLQSQAEFESPGSGRKELAEVIADPGNPLTSRVFVNRVWHWLFGAGIVLTTDDFGHVGDRPSHPELLDYLASRFIQQQWSVKRLVREIVLSETWRQGQGTTKEALTADPTNRLVHHYPLRRLEAESVRDAILFVSGRLDGQLYGPPLNPPRPNEDPQKRLFSGPLDGNGRRSLYTKVTIMEPPKFLAIFNQPTPKIPTGKRDVTTTAAQSLAMLNDPFIVQQAEVFANESIHRWDNAKDRLSGMFEAATGRVATESELRLWSDAVTDLAELHQVAPEDVAKSMTIWKDVAHAMFNLKEFMYVR